MKYDHDRRPRRQVGEPVQVYLDRRDQERLRRLTERLHTTKSAVLRDALEALERQLTDVDQHPALQVIGIAPGPEDVAAPDPARNHDQALAELNERARSPMKRSRRRGA